MQRPITGGTPVASSILLVITGGTPVASSILLVITGGTPVASSILLVITGGTPVVLSILLTIWRILLTMDFHLRQTERKSIYIVREANVKFKKLGIIWSMGKDSTALLFLCKRAFFGKMPFPVVYLDAGHNSPETHRFRNELVREWRIDLTAGQAGLNKVQALKKIVKEHKFEALIVPLRRDARNDGAEEWYFSPRDENFQWDPKKQPPKTFDSLADFKGASHIRVHPFLDWTELDVWQYIKENNVPVNPLYFAKDGKRYRNLEANLAVESNAKTVDEIIKELEAPANQGENAEAQEKEQVMKRLRELGYL